MDAENMLKDIQTQIESIKQLCTDLHIKTKNLEKYYASKKEPVEKKRIQKKGFH